MPRRPLKLESVRRFEKDYRKLKERIPNIVDEIEEVVRLLLDRKALPPGYRDHPLKGHLFGFRDCHIRGDLVLVYRIVGDVLRLERLGTHSQLGL